MTQLTRRIGDACARRPRLTLTTWGLLAALVVALASTAGGSFADDLIAPGSQSEQAAELLEERFPAAARAAGLVAELGGDAAFINAEVETSWPTPCRW